MRKMKGFIFTFLLLFVLFLTPTLVFAGNKPVVTIKDMQLSPYEGCPMEIVVEATGTNLKYQWQICYGDDSYGAWGDNVDVDDNARYQGTKTPHFKIHTYFGDTYDEDFDICKIRCKVTGDGGTSYSQSIWFGIKEREVVDVCSLSEFEEPVYGQTPNYEVESSEPDKYEVTDVNWFGPKLDNGAYHKMSENSKFAEGEFYCRIDVSVKDSYKFADGALAYVNGNETELNVISGSEKTPFTYDTYFIIQRYTIKKEVIKKVEISDIKMPIAGEYMEDMSYTTVKIPENALYEFKSAKWCKEDGSLPENKLFEAGTKYRLDVLVSPKDGYCFDLDETLVTVNGYLGTIARILENDDTYIRFFAKAKEPEVPDKPINPDDPKPNSNPFIDVKESDYYYDSVLWAVENGITLGLTETVFSPDSTCTRAQAVTFLWRNAGKPEPQEITNPFTDVKEGSYYYKAVLWAVEEGITTGVTQTTFCPDANCTRGQIVTFLWRANGEKTVNTTNPFIDVTYGHYYYKAVLWAVEEGITTGLTQTTFCPDTDCTRGQIVTFLYRSVS